MSTQQPDGLHLFPEGPLDVSFDLALDLTARAAEQPLGLSLEAGLATVVYLGGAAVLALDTQGNAYLPGHPPVTVRARLRDADGNAFGSSQHPLRRWQTGAMLRKELVTLVIEGVDQRNLELSTVPLPGGSGLMVNDVTASRRSTETLIRLAATDELTGLANGRALRRSLNDAIASHRADALTGTATSLCSLLLIALDGNRLVADGTGRQIGELIITETGRRIRAIVPRAEFVAHLGGERFAVLLENVDQEATAVSVAELIRRAVNASMSFGAREFRVTASVGVVFNGPRTEDASQMLANADIALRAARAKGSNDWAVFDSLLRTHTASRLRTEALLDDALRSDGIAVEYQPVVHAMTRRLLGFEALVRIKEGQAVLAPIAFLGVAEETGRISRIDSMVLDRSCAELARLQELAGGDRIWMSANLSVTTALRADLYSFVMETCERHRVDPSRLHLDLHEAVLLEAGTATRAALAELHGDGVSLVLDGHGTGRIGLDYIGDFPVSMIKLSAPFVQAVTTSTQEREIVTAVVRHAASLGISVAAKGVETIEQAQILATAGCTRLQGFLFGKPLPADDASRLVVRAAAKFDD